MRRTDDRVSFKRIGNSTRNPEKILLECHSRSIKYIGLRNSHHLIPLYPSPFKVRIHLNPSRHYGSYSRSTDSSDRKYRHWQSPPTGQSSFDTAKGTAGQTHSLGAHRSAIVPPTIVAPVDPNEPCRKRAIMTVWMFFDLSTRSDISKI